MDKFVTFKNPDDGESVVQIIYRDGTPAIDPDKRKAISDYWKANPVPDDDGLNGLKLAVESVDYMPTICNPKLQKVVIFHRKADPRSAAYAMSPDLIAQICNEITQLPQRLYSVAEVKEFYIEDLAGPF